MREPREIEHFYLQIRNRHYQAHLFHPNFSESAPYGSFYGGGGGAIFGSKISARATSGVSFEVFLK